MHMQVMELVALSLHVRRIIFKCHIFSQDANEMRTCCDGTIFHVSHVSVALQCCSLLAFEVSGIQY